MLVGDKVGVKCFVYQIRFTVSQNQGVSGLYRMTKTVVDASWKMSWESRLNKNRFVFLSIVTIM